MRKRREESTHRTNTENIEFFCFIHFDAFFLLHFTVSSILLTCSHYSRMGCFFFFFSLSSVFAEMICRVLGRIDFIWMYVCQIYKFKFQGVTKRNANRAIIFSNRHWSKSKTVNFISLLFYFIHRFHLSFFLFYSFYQFFFFFFAFHWNHAPTPGLCLHIEPNICFCILNIFDV